MSTQSDERVSPKRSSRSHILIQVVALHNKSKRPECIRISERVLRLAKHLYYILYFALAWFAMIYYAPRESCEMKPIWRCKLFRFVELATRSSFSVRIWSGHSSTRHMWFVSIMEHCSETVGIRLWRTKRCEVLWLTVTICFDYIMYLFSVIRLLWSGCNSICAWYYWL